MRISYSVWDGETWAKRLWTVRGDRFVALDGLLLMPMGAIVFVDFWFARRLGFHANWAEWAGRSFNRAALLTWVLTLAACLS